MEFIHVLMVAAVLAAGAVTFNRSARQRRIHRDLERLASELGFRIVEQTHESGVLSGTILDVTVTIELSEGTDSPKIALGVHAPSGLGPNVRVGLDPRQPIGLESDQGATAAYVDGELLAIAEGAHFVSIDRERAVLHFQLDELLTGRSATDRLHRLVKWSIRSSSRSANMSQRLAENAMHNPDPGTRIRALRALRACYPETDAAHEARRAGLDDPVTEVRVEAATRLGPDGIAVLAAVVRDGRAQGALRVRAIDRLAAESTRGILQRVLFDVSFDADRDVSIAALRGLAECADDATTGRIIAMARFRTLDDGPLVALAEFLGAKGGDDAAALVLSLLEVRSEPQIIEAAAVAAIAMGPGVAVRAMAILKERPSLANIREIRRTIDRLRFAIGNGRKGGLALTEGEGGRLSVSDGSKGAISGD